MNGPWVILHAAPTTTCHGSTDALMLLAPLLVAGTVLFGPRLMARFSHRADDGDLAGGEAAPAPKRTASRRPRRGSGRHSDEPI